MIEIEQKRLHNTTLVAGARGDVVEQQQQQQYDRRGSGQQIRLVRQARRHLAGARSSSLSSGRTLSIASGAHTRQNKKFF